MTMVNDGDTLRLEGDCLIEEAETLLNWLLDHPQGVLDVALCEQIHTAVLQVIMAVQPPLTGTPVNPLAQQLLISVGVLTA